MKKNKRNRDSDEVKKNKRHEERKGRLIPEGELKCVWMEAGLVSYKLCDYEYECERCPFDQVFRIRTNASGSQESGSGKKSEFKTIPVEKDTKEKLPLGLNAADFDTIFQDFYDITIKGNLFYHPGHTWVDVESTHCVKIGLDDFAGTFLLGIKMAILPAANNGIDGGQICCWIVVEEGTFPIVAPLTGSVIAVNHRISQEPHLINRSPYEQGWLMKIKPENLHRDLTHLYREDDVLPRCKKDLETLRGDFEAILKENWEELGPTLCDGGNVLVHLRDILGPKRYSDMLRAYFSGKETMMRR